MLFIINQPKKCESGIDHRIRYRHVLSLGRHKQLQLELPLFSSYSSHTLSIHNSLHSRALFCVSHLWALRTRRCGCPHTFCLHCPTLAHSTRQSRGKPNTIQTFLVLFRVSLCFLPDSSPPDVLALQHSRLLPVKVRLTASVPQHEAVTPTIIPAILGISVSLFLLSPECDFHSLLSSDFSFFMSPLTPSIKYVLGHYHALATTNPGPYRVSSLYQASDQALVTRCIISSNRLAPVSSLNNVTRVNDLYLTLCSVLVYAGVISRVSFSFTCAPDCLYP